MTSVPGFAVSRAGPKIWPGALMAPAVFLLIAHVPVPGGFAAGLLAVLMSVVFPRLAAPLCVAAALLQDAPGLFPWACVGTALACGVRHMAWRGVSDLMRADRWLRWTILASLSAVALASAVSCVGLLRGQPEQSPGRPFGLVAVADAMMIVVGGSIGCGASRDARIGVELRGACAAGLACMALRVLLQAFIDPLAGFSGVGVEGIREASQLSDMERATGVRYVGSMLTPNAMSIATALSLLMTWCVLPVRRLGWALLFAGTALVAALAAGSKSSLIVAVAMAIAFPLAASTRIAFTLLGLALSGVSVAFLSNPDRFAAIMDRFRFSGVGDDGSIRSRAYEACAGLLRGSDAVLGLGLSHWPVFFAERIGQPMSDPHTLIFSYAWTYGIAGPIALVVACIALLRSMRHVGHAEAACVLLACLLVRDLFAIPLLLGSTVLTLLFWTCLGTVLEPRPVAGTGVLQC